MATIPINNSIPDVALVFSNSLNEVRTQILSLINKSKHAGLTLMQQDEQKRSFKVQIFKLAGKAYGMGKMNIEIEEEGNESTKVYIQVKRDANPSNSSAILIKVQNQFIENLSKQLAQTSTMQLPAMKNHKTIFNFFNLFRN